MKIFLPLFIVVILSGCAGRQVFENKEVHYKLILKKDASYKLKYPTFIRRHVEKGTYQIENGSLWLKHITAAPTDSILSFSCGFAKHAPDTLEFFFTNLHDSGSCVLFTINDNPQGFKTDFRGHLKLSYAVLIEQKVITADSTFRTIRITYNTKTYIIKTSETKALVKPTMIWIRLNEYIGEKSIEWNKSHSYSADTILFHGRNLKGSPKVFKMVKK